MPTPVILPPKIEEPDPYAAFRPIMPEQYVPSPIQTVPIPESRSELPIVESPTDTTAQATIDELRRTIVELESQLAEAKEIPLPISDPLSPPEKPMRSLPIINNPGVQVFLDDVQNVRFEVMDKVIFVPDTWQLSVEGEETLRTIVAEIRASDSKSVLDIEGHTDSLMGDPNNPMQKHDIATAKTAAVMDFFVNALRWDAARIGTCSYGRSRPVADNGTPEGRARNNRIEIVVNNAGETQTEKN